ncbi:MAG: TIGR04282 family arsenosugar biosynthesis glycosyltransferase [Alphaproteobacteria bacterium]|nr:TIGR04282 family arsenosugar biosynthesis glycosyltransferase [Alphaproteobacteria bacterium]
MQRHLVVMARAPQLGRVKQRLAQDIGAIAATRFYRALLDEQLGRLARDRRWSLWLFITPDRAVAHPAWRVARSVDVRGQGHGDLGRRMKRPFAALPPGPLVLVGSDIPLMGRRHIWRAFRLLGRHELVFGPASDGGFWLVGARRSRPLPKTLFEGVRWSTADALADSLATLPSHLSVGFADTLDDVDDGADYARYRAAVSLRSASSARTLANTESQSPGRG